MQARDVREELQRLADPEKAKILQRFFKTGAGEYGEGDIFLGVTVPKSRQVAKTFGQLALDEVKILLYSAIHEERLVALLILVQRFNDASDKEEIVKFYTDNLMQVNNWDLVDLSAPNILGAYLVDKEKNLLYKLAKSENVWERRIAIVSTLHLIRNSRFDDTLRICRMFLHDDHDLVHKAAGWMLREVGKRNFALADAFLGKHYAALPRTMLRYAIERFPEKKKRRYMSKQDRR
jgi:3-methyladenine DNA glycosylase AlkD